MHWELFKLAHPRAQVARQREAHAVHIQRQLRREHATHRGVAPRLGRMLRLLFDALGNGLHKFVLEWQQRGAELLVQPSAPDGDALLAQRRVGVAARKLSTEREAVVHCTRTITTPPQMGRKRRKSQAASRDLPAKRPLLPCLPLAGRFCCWRRAC